MMPITKVGSQTVKYGIINAQNNIYATRSFYVDPYILTSDELQVSFPIGNGGAIEELNVNFISPCAAVGPQTALRVSFQISNFTATAPYTIRPFTHIKSQTTCYIRLNGIRKLVTCTFTDDIVLIQNFGYADLQQNNNLVIESVKVPK